jgi:nucleoside-diphosphate-sugar epimerase
MHLLEAGAFVHGVSRRDVHLDAERWSHTSLDLSDGSAVDKLFAEVRPEYVMHLASCVTGKREIEWVRETMVGNLVSAVHIMTAAQSVGTSKCVIAGSLEEPDPSEPNPVPASPYAASKWCASGYARMIHALYGADIAVARIFMVYGPGQEDINKLIPYVCLSASRSEAPRLMSGDRPVDWIYIDDVVEGLIRLMHQGPVDGGYVDLGSGQLVTTGDVARQVCLIAGNTVEPQLGAIPDRAMEQVRVADVISTEAELDWKAAVDLDRGLALTYRWYQEHGSGDS